MRIELPKVVIDRDGKAHVGFLHAQVRSHIPAGSLRWLVGLSLCALALTIYFSIRAYQFASVAVAVEGKVARIAERPQVDSAGKKSMTYCPSYSYSDRSGVIHEVSDSVCLNSKPEIGSAVKLLYDKQRPESAIVDSVLGRFGSVIASAAATLFLGLMALYAWIAGPHDYKAEMINTEVWVDRGDEARKPFAGATIAGSVGIEKTDCEAPDPTSRR